MIGSIVGNYKITEKIGEGGMGAVFRGVDVMLDREVAIKMLRPELARDEDVVSRFRSEAKTLARLNHPNIATLYSFLRQGEDFFMVMEYVRGKTLERALKDNGAIPCERAIRLFSLALNGIDHAHSQGIIHRDIKPGNIMLTANGSVKVMDFGIARVLGADRMTKTGLLIGTIQYMPPEQIRGLGVDARSDIYSLGIVLYEMLAGRVPFSSTSEYDLMRAQVEEVPPPPTNFAPSIPVGLENVILRALAKEPEARQQTAGEFRSELERILRIPAAHLDTPARAALTTVSEQWPATASPLEKDVTAVAAAAALVKETRLAGAPGDDTNETEVLDSRPQRQPAAGQTAVTGATVRTMGWKKWAAGAAVLCLLPVLSFVLFRGMIRRPTTQTPHIVQPIPNSSENSPQTTAEPAAGSIENNNGTTADPSARGSKETETTAKRPRTGTAASRPSAESKHSPAQPPASAGTTASEKAPPAKKPNTTAPANQPDKSQKTSEANSNKKEKKGFMQKLKRILH